jgi:STE24 endopeptidase
MTRLLLFGFVVLKLAIALMEHALAAYNWRFARDPDRQARAAALLGISDDDMQRSARYSFDRYRFGLVQSWLSTGALLVFVVEGGLGLVERWAKALVGPASGGDVWTGLVFFALLGSGSFLLSLPVSVYDTFVIEQRHGFNRQTPRGFAADAVKGLLLSALLGGPLLAVVLWLVGRAGPLWWLWAWLAVSGFSVLTAWLYPRLLAPLFNRFTPLPEGELRQRILALASTTGFRAGGLFVMDASRRSTHGNAYFTGLFGEKRIVLFDTLLATVRPEGVVAVLAHELGHFKLGHVWRGVVQGLLLTGVLFFALGQLWRLEAPYAAFDLAGPSSYGALMVFGLWYGLVAFFLQPLLHALSRSRERAADAFAVRYVPADDLAQALLALREQSHTLPLSHPLYSRVYHSHPPLLSRLEALDRVGRGSPPVHAERTPEAPSDRV